MLDQNQSLPQSASEILGDLTAFAEQLGSAAAPGQLAVAAVSLGTTPIRDVPGLENFLQTYSSRILTCHELPAIIQAREFAARGEARELIALDQQLSAVPALQDFARASAHVGQAQLRRLRPLRGERVVQRYWQAVDQGQARGWHTLVYGLILSVYAIPLRQGAVHFAHRTLDGFVQAASRRIGISEADQARVLSGVSGLVVATVNAELTRQTPTPLLLV